MTVEKVIITEQADGYRYEIKLADGAKHIGDTTSIGMALRKVRNAVKLLEKLDAVKANKS